MLRAALIFAGTACAGAALAAAPLECRNLGVPLADPSQRMVFPVGGFSVLPPQGKHWCVQNRDGNAVAFMRSPLMGEHLAERPSLARISHTVVATAREVAIEEDGVDSAEDLRAFTARWLQGGGGNRIMGGTAVLDPAPLKRFRLLESKLDFDNSFPASCVRFDAVIEERDNPQRPGAVLVQIIRDHLLCRHPHARDRMYVLIGYSERYLQEARPPSPLLVEAWREELEPFVRSLTFLPIP